MKMLRFALLFGLLTLPLFALPTQAQNTTGGMTTILEEEPSGSGWNAVQADAASQNEGTGHPYYHSTVLEHQTFEGDYTPTRRVVLAIFSDDGCDVTVDGTKVWAGQDKPQALPKLDESLHKLGVTLEPNTKHHIKVDYSNVIYAGGGDTDGVTLFAYGKTTPHITLNTADNPMTATYDSPNGIDSKNVKFTFDGVDETATTTHSSSSLSYTLPDSVSFFASHAVRVEVRDNDGNLGIASVSAHVFLPVTPFQDTSTTTQVSYNLQGSEQVRVRVCLLQTDTAVRTFTTAQGAGEASVSWDGLNDTGNPTDAGVYVFKVEKQIGNSWIDIADIDPVRGDAARLNIDGARLSDEHIHVLDNSGKLIKNRTTAFPTIRWILPSGSWNMVPLVQTGQTLLGAPTDNGPAGSTLDGHAYNYDPAGNRNPKSPKPAVLQGTFTTYWQVQDVVRIRGLSGPYRLPGASAGYHKVNGLPIVDVMTGIPGATVAQLSPGTMAYQGNTSLAYTTAYSFDDGPYNNASTATQNTSTPSQDRAITQDILDLLTTYGIHATFFTNGVRIRASNDANTDTLWNMVSAGHELANHTYSHLSSLNIFYADNIRSELIENHLMERWVIGVKHGSTIGLTSVPYFRPPGGAGVGYSDPSIIDGNFMGDPTNPAHRNDPNFWNTVGEAGYMTIAWHSSPSDPGETPKITVSQQADNIANYLINKPGPRPGDIVLLHNGRLHTVLALKKVIPYLQQNGGWTFTKVSSVSPASANP